MTRKIALLAAAAAALALAAMPAASGAHFAGLDENDVSDELNPSGSDADPIGTDVDGIPGNGFASLTDGVFDLILDAYVVPEDVHIIDPNTVVREATAGVGPASDTGPFIYPGTVDYNAWWGWWDDRGEGRHLNEVPAASDAGLAAQGQADGVIDDGGDNKSRDVSYEEWQANPDECPRGNQDCWQETGPWDEWIARGSGLTSWAGTQTVDADDPELMSSPGDVVKLFIDPGTTARLLEVATGHPEEQKGPSRPGYSVLTDADSRANVPDANCELGGYEDDEGDKSAGESWQCVVGATTDRSLLTSTQVRVAVNASLIPDADGARDLSSALAVDTDHYETVHPQIGALYETYVWDPEDERDAAHEEDTPYPDEGPKETVLEAYTHDLPAAYGTVTSTVAEALKPTEPHRGTAGDFAPFGSARPHEPNHPDDQYPGATYNDGADYQPALQGQYYDPTQSWDGYQDQEHLWVDGWPYYTPFPNLITNVDAVPNLGAPLSPEEQNTGTPGWLVPYARSGTWYDQTEDTWIGNDHPIYAYDNGTTDDPNAYGSEELNLVCSGEGNVFATFYPAKPATRDINGDNKTNIEDRPWGSTDPPVGVYYYNTFGQFLGGVPEDVVGDTVIAGFEILDDPDDERFSNHVQYGSITIGMGCSGRSAGTWFPGKAILMPTGNPDYDIEMVTHGKLSGSGAERIARGTAGDTIGAETVTDVDILYSWT